MSMKKIFAAILALAGLCATSCVQEHIEEQYVPGNVTVQVLGDISGCDLGEDGDITTTYSEVDFGIQVPHSYTLVVDAAGNNFAGAKKVDATFDNGTITFGQKKFNKILSNMGAVAGEAFPVEFRLDAYMLNEKGANVEKYVQHSNVVGASFVTYEEAHDVMDVADVPGDYQGWAPSGYPKLFNYSYDGVIYRGVVDFQCTKEDGTAANGFKITYGGNWDSDSGNWGSAAQAEAAEADQVQLINGDASQNIICYGAFRYYLFEFNKDNLTLTKLRSFNQVGLIGLNGDWDNDVVMTYNMYKGRFWADVDLAGDTEFKFRLDGAWDSNWGGNLEALSGGGDNIPIAAGQYRIYFYMNDTTLYAEIDPDMYGKEEPTIDEPEPEPVTYEGWGITGAIAAHGINWDGDIEMTENGGVWTGYANLTTADQFKFRKDADWVENFGAPGDVEPYTVPVDQAFEAVANGKNMAVAEDGFYKLVLNTNDNTITVSSGEVWGLIGDFNEWSGDSFLTKTGDVWVSDAIALEAGKGFKLRKNSSWDDNRGAQGDVEPFEVTLDTALPVVNNGKNLTVPANGEYIITYDPAAETVTVSVAFPENIWSVIGSFAASGWNNDVKMTLHDGAYRMWISDPFEMKAGDEFKVRFNRSWDNNRGADAEGLTLDYGMTAYAVANGANIKAPADGVYTVIYSETAEFIFFQGWSVIGEISGSSWDKDFAMVPMWDEEFGCIGWVSDAFAYEEGKGFKIRYQSNWDINRGGAFTNWCENFPVTNNGDNIAAGACSNIFVAYSVLDESIYVGRADWSIIGGFNGWSGDIPMLETEPGIYDGSLTLAEASEVKIRKDRAWNEDRGGEFTGIDTPFTAVPGGGNFALEAGSYTIEYNSVKETICVISND